MSKHWSKRSRTSQNAEVDLNISKEDLNPYSRKCRLRNLKNEIQIPMKWIWIPILVSLLEDQDSNSKGMDSNLNFEKGQEALLEKLDSNS